VGKRCQILRSIKSWQRYRNAIGQCDYQGPGPSRQCGPGACTCGGATAGPGPGAGPTRGAMGGPGGLTRGGGTTHALRLAIITAARPTVAKRRWIRSFIILASKVALVCLQYQQQKFLLCRDSGKQNRKLVSSFHWKHLPYKPAIIFRVFTKKS
jgi:hypothetical protein